MSEIAVLHIGKFYPVYGGVEKVMYDLCEGLSKQGIRSDFLGVNADEQKTQIIDINAFFCVYAMASSKKIASTYLSMGFITKLRAIKDQYSIIHIHHPDPMACLALFLSGYKGIVICHWHSDIVKQKMLLKLYTPLQTWMLKRAKLIITTSPNYRDGSPFLQNYLSKIKVLPIGIPPVEKTMQADLRQHIATLTKGKKLVFSLGRLIYYKGYEYLVEAAKLLPDYCFIVGGKGPLKESLEAKVVTLGLSDRFFFVGRIEDEDLPTYYEMSNLFCLPSIAKSEAFGIVQVEAMAYGKPIVATDIAGSGTGWVNAEGISGLNAAPENAKDLAEKIDLILRNDSVEKEYGIAALERYQNLFTQDKMVSDCLGMYKKNIENVG